MVRYTKRKGLEGPIQYPNGQVVYFDPKTQGYWDPTTDFYLSEDEINALKQSLFNIVGGNHGR
jgi:hypothetical protein